MLVDVPKNENVLLNLEGETDLLVEAGFEDLTISQALDLLGLQARMAGILCKEFEGLGQFGPGFFGEEAGRFSETRRVDEIHGFLRRAVLQAWALSRSAAI